MSVVHRKKTLRMWMLVGGQGERLRVKRRSYVNTVLIKYSQKVKLVKLKKTNKRKIMLSSRH